MNYEMFPGMRTLGNASDGDTFAYDFQIEDARRGKKPKQEIQQPTPSPSPKPTPTQR